MASTAVLLERIERKFDDARQKCEAAQKAGVSSATDLVLQKIDRLRAKIPQISTLPIELQSSACRILKEINSYQDSLVGRTLSR